MAFDVSEFSEEAVKELLDAAKEVVEDDETYWREFGSQLNGIRKHCDHLMNAVEDRIDEIATEPDDNDEDEEDL